MNQTNALLLQMKRGGECLVIEEKETKNNYQEEM